MRVGFVCLCLFADEFALPSPLSPPSLPLSQGRSFNSKEVTAWAKATQSPLY